MGIVFLIKNVDFYNDRKLNKFSDLVFSLIYLIADDRRRVHSRPPHSTTEVVF